MSDNPYAQFAVAQEDSGNPYAQFMKKEDRSNEEFLDPDTPKNKEIHPVVDLPLGALETLTTGAVNAIGGGLAAGFGGVAGMLDPTISAQQGMEAAQQRWAESPIGQALAPQTIGGEFLEGQIGKAVESFKDYATDPQRSPLRFIPFTTKEQGDALANSPVGAVIGGLGAAAPDMILPATLAGVRGGPRVTMSRSKGAVTERNIEDAFTPATPEGVRWDKKPLTKEQEAKINKKGDKIRKNPYDPFKQLKDWQDAPQTLPTENVPIDRMAEQLQAERITPEQRMREDIAQQRIDSRNAAANLEATRAAILARNAAERQRMEEGRTGFQHEQVPDTGPVIDPRVAEWRAKIDEERAMQDAAIEARRDTTLAQGAAALSREGTPAPIDPRSSAERFLAEGDTRVADLASQVDELQTQMDTATAERSALANLEAEKQAASAAQERASSAQRAIEERQRALEAEMQRRATLERGAADMARPDQFAVAKSNALNEVAEHPLVKAAAAKVDKASEQLILAAERNPEHTARLDRDLKNLEQKLDTVIDNLVDAKLEKQFGKGIRVPKGQRGAINPEVFKEGFEKLKQLADGTWLRAHSDGQSLTIEAIKDSRKLGGALFEKTDKWNQPSQTDMAATMVGSKQRGIATEVYKFASELGNDIVPSKVRTKEGSAMWDGFERKGLATDGRIKSPGNRQAGALFLGTPKPKKRLEPAPQELVAKKQQAARVAAMVPAKVRALDEFREIKTPEEALALAPTAKDITPDWGQKYLGSGVNFQAIMSNNPLLKYLRTVARDARTAADKFSRDYITDKNKGISSLWTRMSDKQRIDTIKTLLEGDRRQQVVDAAVMDRLGFSDTQRKFVNTFYEANDKLFARWNEVRAKLGFEPIDYRMGHVPGIFIGAYKSVVMEGTGSNARAVGVLAADTMAQLKIAKQHVMDNMKDVSFVDKERASLVGATKRYYSDIFSGMTDVLDMLGKNDPRFAEVQEIVAEALRKSNNRLFAFNVHELHKKGVFGNEGNKPWLSEKENARDAFKAIVRYFEEGALHHELQVPKADLDRLMSHPDTEHLPNTKKFMRQYINKMFGDDIAPLGAAVNTMIDTAFRLVPTASWGGGKATVGVGVGPGTALSVAGGVKNAMSQYFMGWFNYMFTAAQLAQPLQTGTPFMQLVSGRLGLDPTQVAASMSRGGAYFPVAMLEKFGGRKLDFMPEHLRTAFKYAEERGLLTFSEMERAYQGTQNTASRLKDQFAEINMKVGENMTRTPMFMAFTDLLVRGGIDIKQAMPIAENLTQFAMIDYHQWERPNLYSSMGVLGQFAGGLTTFKHGLASQQVKLARELFMPTKLLDEKGNHKQAKHQAAPLAAAVMSMMVFAGITGLPGYSELDTVYGELTNYFGGKYRSIRQDFLENVDAWATHGLVSEALGLNLQTKFSAADMIPDNVVRAASPQLAALGEIIIDGYNFATNPNEVTQRNLAVSATPSAWKGATEAAVSRHPEDFVLGRDGLIVGDSPRNQPIDSIIPGLDGMDPWKARARTGLRPMPEALEREKIWDMRQTDRADFTRRQEIAQEYRQAIIAGIRDKAVYNKLQEEYMKRGGDPKQLAELEVKTLLDMQLTEKQRFEGVPRNSLPSVHRFQNFNE